MHETLRSSTGQTLRGNYLDVAVTEPAKGAEWLFTLPAGAWYRWVLGYAKVNTGGSTEIRRPGAQILDGDGNKRWYGMALTEIGINTSRHVGYGLGGLTPGQSEVFGGGMGLPNVWLPGGWQIGSLTATFTNLDQYSKVMLWLEAAYDEHPGHAPGGEVLSAPHWSDRVIFDAA